MKCDSRPGTVTSFFGFGDRPDWGKDAWNEIDMVEIVPSVAENPFSTNIISKNQTQDQAYVGGFQPGTEWYRYSIEWTPHYIAWFINDHEVRRIEDAEELASLNKPQHLMMNFWTPTFDAWSHGFDPLSMPRYAIFDWIETYYWTGGNSFSLLWYDDFKTFDDTHWIKSDGKTFDNNSSTFYASQVYIQNEMLHIKMEP